MISRNTYDLIPINQVRALDGDNLGSVDGANHNAGCPECRHVSVWRHYGGTNQRCNLYNGAQPLPKCLSNGKINVKSVAFIGLIRLSRVLTAFQLL